MKALYWKTPWSRTSAFTRLLALSALAASAWALSVSATPAQAGDVVWSIGIQQPGVSVGVSNGPGVVVRPHPGIGHRPVVVYPHPVVVHQPPGYGRPVGAWPPGHYASPGYSQQWDERHGRYQQHWHPRQQRDERHARHDRRDRDDRYDRDGRDGHHERGGRIGRSDEQRGGGDRR